MEKLQSSKITLKMARGWDASSHPLPPHPSLVTTIIQKPSANFSRQGTMIVADETFLFN